MAHTSNFAKNLRCYCWEFCQSTSIHGFRFLGEQRRSAFERYWWLATIAVSLYFCTGLILETYERWEKHPVVVTFAVNQTAVWEIPFPAVTICPEAKTSPSVYNFTEMHRKKRAMLDRDDGYEFMSILCSTKEPSQVEYLDARALDFIVQVAPNFNDSFESCQWMQREQNISEALVPVITDAGVCYTFNILDREEMFTTDVYHYGRFHLAEKSQEWSLDRGFSEIINYSYPLRTYSSGAKTGLHLNLKSSRANKDYRCTGGLKGFKVHVHHPADIPRVEENFFWVGLDQVVNAAVKPHMITSNEKLHKYTPKQRKCFFPEDKSLRFFTAYSQQNCQVECLANFTFNDCRCVAFHMPRLNTTSICGSAKKSCLASAEERFLANDFSLKMNEAETTPPNEICNCLPSCFSTNYDVEISQTTLEGGYSKCSGDYHEVSLRIYFKERQFLASERNELYGQTDFLANCGGLLSLFVGFSFISVVEIFYFLSIRVGCNMKRFGKVNWAGGPKEP